MSSGSRPPEEGKGKMVPEPPLKRQPSDFIFGKLIGEGSFSSVFLCKEVKTGKEFAIKVLEKPHIIREKKTEYVKRERDVFAKIQKHPFFVNLFYTFQDADRLYFVLSYARRGELLDYIKKLGCFDCKCTQFYAAEIVVALQHLHSLGIIHRDLKPENILLNDTMHIQITDFGSAKILGKTVIEQDAAAVNGEECAPRKRKNSFVGTAQYVSPEVLRSKVASVSSDLWALGCIIFQFLSGELPFWGGHEYQIFQKILALDYEFPEGFDQVAKDLVKNLLVLEQTGRLGSDEAGGFEALMNHKFFEGVDWASLADQEAPELLPYLPPMGEHKEPLWGNKPGFNLDASVLTPPVKTPLVTEDERLRRLDEQKKSNPYHTFVEGNLILKQGLVDKRKGLFARRRMLLLTEGPHLYYVDSANMVLKGQIPWSNELRPEPKDFKIFFVHTPKRTYYLEDKEGNGLKWCEKIEEIYTHYYGSRPKQNPS